MLRAWAVLLLLAPAVLVQADETSDKQITFEADVRPILKAHCWHCHGEEAELEGGLDLRLARLLVKGGESGPAIVPGKSGESLLYQKIETGEMPPGDKPLSTEDVDIISRWIDAGAPTARPEPESMPAAAEFTPEERSHWSFQPVRRPDLPAVRSPQLVSEPVDAFLLAALEKRGLSFSPAADRATLLRRLSYDLTGLPPTPEEIEQFSAASGTDDYEREVDRLLASPAFGERWGRHWLDVAGYADSDGYDELDRERKWAYKYRDYVIRSFNVDKPWDRFLLEQLAGDELVPQPFHNLTAEQADCLIATGLLRMAPDGTAGAADANLARNDVIAETIKIVSTSMLGLSVGCAQCHSHRYDPISHEDYHRLRAVFEPAFDWKKWTQSGSRLVSLWSDEVRAQAEKVDAELKDINQRRDAELDAIIKNTFEAELAKLPAEMQQPARAARETSEKDRNDQQKQLIKEYPFLNVDRGSVYLYLPDRQTEFNKKWDELTAATSSRRPSEDFVACLAEQPAAAAPTFLFARGDINSPRGEVLPGELAVLQHMPVAIPVDDPALPTSGRRLAYARHLTSGQHPLVARVLVNRFWMHVFGRGLVSTAADFGTQGEPPSHPELLDWLADEFVRGGWKLKPLVRMLVMSTAYRQNTIRDGAQDAIDPDNRLLGRMNVRRLEAETIRDWLLATSGRLSRKMYGPPVPLMPDDVGQIVVGIDTRDSAGRPSGKFVSLGEEEFRRSIYVQVRRSMPLGALEPFDMPLMTPNCELRQRSTVAPQSLLLMNSDLVVNLSQAMAARVAAEAGQDRAAQFRRAWLLAFSRPASREDEAAGLAFWDEQAAALRAETPEGQKPEQSLPAEQAALAQLCHALLISNDFLYVD